MNRSAVDGRSNGLNRSESIYRLSDGKQVWAHVAKADDQDSKFFGHDRSFDGLSNGQAGVGRCKKEDDGAIKDLTNRLGHVEQSQNAVQHCQDQRPDDGA